MVCFIYVHDGTKRNGLYIVIVVIINWIIYRNFNYNCVLIFLWSFHYQFQGKCKVNYMYTITIWTMNVLLQVIQSQCYLRRYDFTDASPYPSPCYDMIPLKWVNGLWIWAEAMLGYSDKWGYSDNLCLKYYKLIRLKWNRKQSFT